MKVSYIQADKTRYQKNASAYTLVLISIVTSLVAWFTSINYDNFGVTGNTQRIIPDVRIGLEIALGIVLMLGTFLAAERVKIYDIFWSTYGLFILAGINFIRIFNIPFYAYSKGWIPQSTQWVVIVMLVATVILLLSAGVISLRKSIILREHMKELNKDGNDAA